MTTNTKIKLITLLLSSLLTQTVQASESASDIIIVTFADARTGGGIRQSAIHEDGLDSPGDVFVFDQKLLGKDAKTIIGRNAGYCIRTDPGAADFSSTDHPTLADDPNNNFSQCTWTLSFNKNSGYLGSLTVSGREADLGTSHIPVIGGTGDFTGATGVLSSTPLPKGKNGRLYRQEITLTRTDNKGTVPHDSSSD